MQIAVPTIEQIAAKRTMRDSSHAPDDIRSQNTCQKELIADLRSRMQRDHRAANEVVIRLSWFFGSAEKCERSVPGVMTSRVACALPHSECCYRIRSRLWAMAFGRVPAEAERGRPRKACGWPRAQAA
jgi:hypothetical protein